MEPQEIEEKGSYVDYVESWKPKFQEMEVELNQSIQDMNTREECMTIDLEKVAALMSQAASDGEWCKESNDGWTKHIDGYSRKRISIRNTTIRKD